MKNSFHLFVLAALAFDVFLCFGNVNSLCESTHKANLTHNSSSRVKKEMIVFLK